MQIFDPDHRLGFRQLGRDLMQRISANIRHPFVCFGQPPDRFLPVLAAFNLSAHRSLQPDEFARVPSVGLGVRENRPVADDGQVRNSQVHACSWFTRVKHRIRNFLLYLQGHVPPACLLTYRRGQYFGAIHRQVALFLEPQSAQSRQLDGLLEHTDGSGDAKAAQAVFL